MGSTRARVSIDDWNEELISSLVQEKSRFPRSAALILPCKYVPVGKAIVCVSEVKADSVYYFLLILLNPKNITAR